MLNKTKKKIYFNGASIPNCTTHTTFKPTERACARDIACGGSKNVQRTEASCVLGKWSDNVCWGNEYIECMAGRV